MLTELEFHEGRMTAGEYAALWGCDPCYDRSPRIPGDGYLFYNYSVEGKDPAFCTKFIPAIDRTIAERRQRGGDGMRNDVKDLLLLKLHVTARTYEVLKV